jgi:hypothetical protein
VPNVTLVQGSGRSSRLIGELREGYNNVLPHSSLRDLPPAPVGGPALDNRMVEHYRWGVSSGSGTIIGSEETFLVMRAGEREAES